jgi:streptomycin 6-kinase
MTSDMLKTQAQDAHAAGNRAEVSRLVAVAVARLHAPSRAPLAAIAGHVRHCWGLS